MDSGFGVKSDIPSTFTGERGGEANNDADLLAELRAISMKNASADRFADDDDDDNEAQIEKAPVATKKKAVKKPSKKSTPSRNRDGRATPPWKKKGSAKKKPMTPIEKEQNKADTSPTTPKEKSPSPKKESPLKSKSPSPKKDSPSPKKKSPSRFFGGFQKKPSTFTGERGGAAEDEDLLAELRAISMGNSSADRFGEEDETDPLSPPVKKAMPTEKPWLKKKKKSVAKKEETKKEEALTPRNKRKDGEVPPWKQKNRIVKKPSNPFDDDEDNDIKDETNEPKSSPAKSPRASPAKASPPKFGGFKKGPSTFTGERGGAAEDEDLLAELRAISMGNSSSNRFAGDDDEDSLPVPPPRQPVKKKTPPVAKKSPVRKSNAPPRRNAGAPPPWKKTGTASSPVRTKRPVASGPKVTSNEVRNDVIELPPKNNAPSGPVDDIVVSADNVADYVTNKNWKLRKASYDVLEELLEEKTKGIDPMNTMDGSDIHPCVTDELVATMAKDSNAAALDSALRFVFGFVDYCKNGCNPDFISMLSAAIITGPALSATRPSTSKSVDAVLMKIMQVGRNEPSSIHIVVEHLIEHGITSKKPKVVIKSSALILDGALAFGAAMLPLAKVTSNSEKMLSHMNGDVRGNGMNILAEICRAVGSKEPLSNIIESMKSSQVSELDGLLESQSNANPPQIGLRYSESASSANDALEVLQAGAEEDAAERFLAREAVNIFDALKGTEYKAKMKEAKWSEKVGALDILLEAGGEQPYKLVQPSTSANYKPLISEMKKLLSHTHFAVKSKAMHVLGMLAEGVGEKLYPNLRPLLVPLLELSKDKKVTKAVEKCVDSLFDNVLSFSHLVEDEDSLRAVLNEKKQKNTLVRVTTLSFLQRCISRSHSLKKRGTFDSSLANQVGMVCVEKLNDSDAGVRKEVAECLRAMKDHPDENIRSTSNSIINDLQQSHPRVYKSLSSKTNNGAGEARPPLGGARGPSRSRSVSRSRAATPKSNAPNAKSSPRRSSSRPSSGARRSALPQGLRKSGTPGSPQRKSAPAKKSRAGTTKGTSASSPTVDFTIDIDENGIPDLEESTQYISSLDIPDWQTAEESGDVVTGLQSSDWKSRKAAIESLIIFSKTSTAKSDGIQYVSKVLVLVKNFTKQFKDSNFNIAKASCELFLSMCDVIQENAVPMDFWICRDAVLLSVTKIADKKFAQVAPPLLSRLCEVQLPEIITRLAITDVESIKSPLPHEGLLNWGQTFCLEFGAHSLGKNMKNVIEWVLKECGSTNVKVKTAAYSLCGTLHVHLGPSFKALLMSTVSDDGIRTQVEKKIESNPFDASASAIATRKCLVASETAGGDSSGGNNPVAIDLPKTDLMTKLPSDIIERMETKNGKDAWKKRKAALEEVADVSAQYKGILSTSPESMRGLVDLSRALKSRLGDSQGNLKPIAARNIAVILNSVDGTSQAKLGRIVYAALIHLGMNDNKKIVRDAALEAIEQGILLTDIDGGGINPRAMEPLMAGFVSELNESEFKAIGLPDIFNILLRCADFFPTLANISTSKGRTTLTQFGQTLIRCLTSSRSETRSGAEALLRKCIENGVLTITLLEKAVSKLLPAEQRKVQPVIESLSSVEVANDTRPSKGASRKRSATPSSRQSISGRQSTSGRTMSSRSTSVSRSGRQSLGGGSTSNTVEILLNDSNFHPLVSPSSPFIPKHQRLMRQKDKIPEYPEEPSGKDDMTVLKKSWSNFLPPDSVEIFFPQNGFQKQDDASDGCILLSHALSLVSKASDANIVIEQLDLILRWFTLALCSRETTSGMEALLGFFNDLTVLLRANNYQFSDAESALVLPYLIEKAGVAKGRFREKLRELLDTFANGDLYSLTKYGSQTCVSVIERTSNSKARGIAIKALQQCTDSNGLNAIGKKGIIITAKGFSEENLPENKSLYLDLIETVLSRMNGDTSKYFKICGTTALSSKARDAIEQRLLKGPSSPRRTPASTSSASKTPSQENNEVVDEDGPFKFSFNTAGSKDSEGSRVSLHEGMAQRREASSGAAASLRHRLQQIRDKHVGDGDVGDELNEFMPTNINHSTKSIDPPEPCPLYDEIVQSVETLLGEPTPLLEINDQFTKALVSLRQLHSSLSNSNNDSTGTDPQLLLQLKEHLQYKVANTVKLLTRVLEFGFRCGTPTNRDGLSVPLLSVSIAGLMAIFLDGKLASQVVPQSLSLVIYQGTAALLDKRLSATATPESSGLDSSTSKKMVKAINKLAIQASYGATRHVSLITLISLQLKLCSSNESAMGQSDVKTTNHRMSRIITKLFARVIKAQESEISPFSSRDFNIGSVLRTIEESIQKCNEISPQRDLTMHSSASDLDSYNADRMSPCRDLIQTFVHHLLKAKNNQGKIVELRKSLESVGLTEKSLTGKAFTDSCGKIGISPLFSASLSRQTSVSVSYDVDYLSELIFAVGGAEDDQERVEAMGDLREYVEAHKDIDIESHLSGVSGPFRKYILEQLRSPFRPLITPSERSLVSGIDSSVMSNVNMSTRSVVSQWSTGNMSMSEKLRYLKSKINAAEVSHSKAHDLVENSEGPPSPPRQPYKTYESSPEPTGQGVSSLRQRLAAATERAKMRSPEPLINEKRPSSAVGNAAALRLRLESVRGINRD